MHVCAGALMFVQYMHGGACESVFVWLSGKVYVH